MRNDTLERTLFAVALGAAMFMTQEHAQAEDQDLLKELDGYTNHSIKVNQAKIDNAKKQMGSGIRG